MKSIATTLNTPSTMLRRFFRSICNLDPWQASQLCKRGQWRNALEILKTTQALDTFLYMDLLKSCIQAGALSQGKLVHAHMKQSGFNPDIILNNTLLNLYTKCTNNTDSAMKLFHEMPIKDVYSWTTMIMAFSKSNKNHEALKLYQEMQTHGVSPNHFTYSLIVSVCSSGFVDAGMKVHEEIIERGFQNQVTVATALLDMYCRAGMVEKARQVFDKMSERNVVSWNAMIGGYARRGEKSDCDNAIQLFMRMQKFGFKPSAMTFSSILPSLKTLKEGLGIHTKVMKLGFQDNVFVMTGLVTMYARFGEIGDARQVFDKMPIKDPIACRAMISIYTQNGLVDEALDVFGKAKQNDLVLWNGMISGLVQNAHAKDALNLFNRMRSEGVTPDSKIYATVLSACANLAALKLGEDVHAEILSRGMNELSVNNALVDMYSKCGKLEKAREIFYHIEGKDVVSWNTMIGAYATHGLVEKAIETFERMTECGISPNHVTSVNILSACSRAGLVDYANQFFSNMSEDFGIRPAIEHYSCMVDLLGKTGHLDEAYNLIINMPIEAAPIVWSSLLNACRMHKNVELAENISEKLFDLDPENAAPYALMSNIYAEASRWEDLERVRKLMRDRGIRKTPGSSWIEVDGQVHTFVVADKTHPQTKKIYSELTRLSNEMKAAGYISDTRFVLNDIENEEEKEQVICLHSEKLAIIFGILNKPPGDTIRVVKNLRVCGDCHSATKFISKLIGREIVVRDSSRYHHFKNGDCSCGEFW